MKFENPIINISTFEIENVITGSAPEGGPKKAEDAVSAFIAQQAAGSTSGGYKIVF